MFTDSVELDLQAGNGGSGIVAWRREKYIPKGGPAGGDGGKGGSIIFKADRNLFSLENLRNLRFIQAKNGLPGSNACKQGKTGIDTVLKIPLGTIMRDRDTQEILFDFTEHEQEFAVCKGGKGGKGNTHFKSSTHQAPNYCTPGTEGQSRKISLELKLIADVGLVGMPNAGKSTLLKALTKVPVKIAPYPFTTLRPNIGLLLLDDYSRLFIADIPGIISEAHEDRGLGLSFLKHIERTYVLLYIIDISAIEERNPFEDFQILQNELNSYNTELAKKPFLVALNKIDEKSEEYLQQFKKQYPFDPSTLFEISGKSQEGLKPLIEAFSTLVHQLRPKRFS